MEKNASNDVLEDGINSGSVPQYVKRQIYIQQRGICAEPDCDELVDRQYTRIGDCAHIIPKKVGSHPREDYKTSLDDRKKEPNLLYLCKIHHALIDDPKHADKYTADVLRGWKSQHKEWTQNISKKSRYIPEKLINNVNNILENFGIKLSDEIEISSSIINQLIDSCRELIHRRLINDANTVLSHIELLLSDINNTSFELRVKVLEALCLLGNENIQEAKLLMKNVIEKYPSEVEPMIEYFEICQFYPEPGDEAEKIEAKIIEIDSENEILKLHDFRNQLETQNITIIDLDKDDVFEDKRINCRFLFQKAIYFDQIGDKEKRDECIDKSEESLPTSSKPNMFRVIFHNSDYVASEADKEAVIKAIKFTKEQRELIQNKDPLSLKDQLLWLFQDLQTELNYSKIVGSNSNTILIRDEIIAVLSKSYFNRLIDINLCDMLSRVRLDESQFVIILDKIGESNVIPTPQTIEMLFLQELRLDKIEDDFEKFIETYGDDFIKKLSIAIKDKQEEEVIKLLREKSDSFFSIVLFESISDVEFRLKLLGSYNEGVDDNTIHALNLLRLESYQDMDEHEEVDKLLSSYGLEGFSPQALSIIEKIAHERKKWNVFIPAAEKLLKESLIKSPDYAIIREIQITGDI